MSSTHDLQHDSQYTFDTTDFKRSKKYGRKSNRRNAFLVGKHRKTSYRIAAEKIFAYLGDLNSVSDITNIIAKVNSAENMVRGI